MANKRLERYKDKFLHHIALAERYDREARAVLELFDGRPLAHVRYRMKNALMAEHYKLADFYALQIGRMLRKRDQNGRGGEC